MATDLSRWELCPGVKVVHAPTSQEYMLIQYTTTAGLDKDESLASFHFITMKGVIKEKLLWIIFISVGIVTGLQPFSVIMVYIPNVYLVFGRSKLHWMNLGSQLYSWFCHPTLFLGQMCAIMSLVVQSVLHYDELCLPWCKWDTWCQSLILSKTWVQLELIDHSVQILIKCERAPGVWWLQVHMSGCQWILIFCYKFPIGRF